MKSIASFLFLFVAVPVFSQSTKTVEDHQLTVNILLPGLVYEAGLSENATFTAEATIGAAYRESDFFESGFGVYPIGKLQYRHYYNFQRRLEKGKRISGNSGNYVAPMFGIQGGNAVIGDLDFTSSYFVGAGIVYGLQRTAPKGFQFRLEVGPAYFIDEFDKGFGLLLAAKIGWVVTKRK